MKDFKMTLTSNQVETLDVSTNEESGFERRLKTNLIYALI